MNLGIGYESSDEEDIAQAAKPQKAVANDTPAADPAPLSPSPQRLTDLSVEVGPVNGPLGPTASPPPTTSDSPENGPPGSPYTSSRSIIRNLTLPTVPDFDIPPSPPGSPPLQATKKFAQFLDLKRKGQHFNHRLEGSFVLRDPGHIQRLLDFAGINEAEQYMSTLPMEVAVPTTFPDWAYVEELRASQKKIATAREAENSLKPRDSIDFISATRSGTPSGTGVGLGKTARQSAAERVMAGLDRRSPVKRKS